MNNDGNFDFINESQKDDDEKVMKNYRKIAPTLYKTFLKSRNVPIPAKVKHKIFSIFLKY